MITRGECMTGINAHRRKLSDGVLEEEGSVLM
jgi:hypothetical protein